MLGLRERVTLTCRETCLRNGLTPEAIHEIASAIVNPGNWGRTESEPEQVGRIQTWARDFGDACWAGHETELSTTGWEAPAPP